MKAQGIYVGDGGGACIVIMCGHTFEEFPSKFADKGLHNTIMLVLKGVGDDGREECGDDDGLKDEEPQFPRCGLRPKTSPNPPKARSGSHTPNKFSVKRVVDVEIGAKISSLGCEYSVLDVALVVGDGDVDAVRTGSRNVDLANGFVRVLAKMYVMRCVCGQTWHHFCCR